MKKQSQACSQRVIAVSKEVDSLSCPGHIREVWNMHPRVFLQLDSEGCAICPYCSTKYVVE